MSKNQLIELKPVSLSEEEDIKPQPKKILQTRVYNSQNSKKTLNKSYEGGNNNKKLF